MTAHCSSCGKEHNRKGQRYCADCHAAYMRGWRPNHPLLGLARDKDTSRSIASVYKHHGKIKHQPCAVCGSPNSEMHHPDHELPRSVTWLCRPCHLAWHAFWRSAVLEIFTAWVDGAREASPPKREAA